MRILLTGVTGLFGRYIAEMNPDPSRISIVGTSRRQHAWSTLGMLSGYSALPFGNRTAYSRLIDDVKPDVVVNTGGQGNVDFVDGDLESAVEDNVAFPIFLMERCAQSGARLVHFSSNAVYGGDDAPYSEISPAAPVNSYGRLKSQVDTLMRGELARWTILRPTVGYGWHHAFGRGNPISLTIPTMLEGHSSRMVVDQIENPVYAGDVALTFWKMMTCDFSGELNVAGGDDGVSRYEWLRTAAAQFGIPANRVAPARMNDFRSGARRPADTRFDTAKLRAVLGIEPKTVADGAVCMREDSARSPLSVKIPA